MDPEALALCRGKRAMEIRRATTEQFERDTVCADGIIDLGRRRRACFTALGTTTLAHNGRFEIALEVIEGAFPRRTATRNLLLQHRHRGRCHTLGDVFRPCDQRRYARVIRTRRQSPADFDIRILAWLKTTKHL